MKGKKLVMLLECCLDCPRIDYVTDRCGEPDGYFCELDPEMRYIDHREALFPAWCPLEEV